VRSRVKIFACILVRRDRVERRVNCLRTARFTICGNILSLQGIARYEARLQDIETQTQARFPQTADIGWRSRSRRDSGGLAGNKTRIPLAEKIGERTGTNT